MADNSNTLTLTLQVKDDGSVIVDTTKGKIDALNQSTVSGGKSVIDVLGGMKAGYVAVAAVAAATYATVKEFLDAANEAEQIESRMAFQIKAVGYEFGAVKPLVDDFANSVLETTRFSDEMARQGLGQMMQYTRDLGQGMAGVKLAMDMTTQTGMGLESTTRAVGMAMNGNVEMLGRWIPELRDLDSKLGSTATEAERAAYGIGILTEKFGGASLEDMKTLSARLENAKNQFGELKEMLGEKVVKPAMINWMDWGDTLITRPLKALSKLSFDLGARMGGSSGKELAGRELQRLAIAEKEAALKAEALAAEEKEQKAEEKRVALSVEIQKATFDFYQKEATLRNDRMTALSMQQAGEIKAIWDKYKASTDVNTLLAAAEKVHHAQRLELIKKQKEEEVNAVLSLATMYKGYYDDRISKENEIIGLIKGTGIETTVGAKFEFAGVEEQFRKVTEQAGLFTPEEMEKIKAVYQEKLKAISPFAGGEWEEISVATGSEIGPGGQRKTTWGTDWRWKPGMMDEEQRRVEQMREESMRRIEATSAGVQGSRPEDIIGSFDQKRQQVIELQQQINAIKDVQFAVQATGLAQTINDLRALGTEVSNLNNKVLNIGVNIDTEAITSNIEQQLVSRINNKRSPLGSLMSGGGSGRYGNE